MGQKTTDLADQLHFECLEFIQKHMFREPRTRQDSRDRKLRNKITTETVVKSSLNKFRKQPALALRQPLDVIAQEVNIATAEVYLLANLHVIRMCRTKQPVPCLNQDFSYTCLSAGSKSNRKKPETKDCLLRESIALYHSWRDGYQGHIPPDSLYLASGFYQNVSMQMETNTRVATSTQSGHRLQRYLRHKHQLDKGQTYKLQSDIMSVEYEGNDELVVLYRQKLRSRPSYGKLEDYAHLVMPMQYEILQYFENMQAETSEHKKQLRLFNLVPTKQGFSCGHIKICNNGLHGLLKRSCFDVPLVERLGGKWLMPFGAACFILTSLKLQTSSLQ